MKKILSSIFALMLLFALAACGGGNGGSQGKSGDTEGDTAKTDEYLPSQLIIATGGTSGTYYPLGGGIAQIISDNTDVSATAQTTGGSVENMRLLGNQEVDLAFVQNDIADYAAKGTMMFEGTKVENLQGLAALYNETIQIVLPGNSTITSVADLKGKRVSVGAPGSGVEANAMQILEIYGMTFDDLKAQRLSFGDSVQSMQDGNLDAAFVTAGAPTSAVTELSATNGVKLITLEDEKVDELIAKYPYYVKETIPADTYPGVGETHTVAVKAMLAVSKTLPEEFVYNATKALFENVDKLIAINKKAESIKIDTATEGITLDIHPGALKYFQENGAK
ncbi:TRAP transporter solute receptor, TAXI family [Schinkia azotoformans MEV2011]|uniref:TRAP transporter solute receptor, TAXI family n=1 Tax=Schinkia azotoformans MEV2011 TaxID=1348973 RepID=A0A072NIT7_SCHAZ|nr:TAXI family TRAP transporter solute-binding subunit [Schinkia azotoformans]KEF36818.1 TRAP transporter solute receptor, TAXI family [Schinkia azotoformans MEV2011]MEC1695193.1 TAXI family TRAP transporter solute-binding subunit [Schinkia azotoformans]MEC1714862.1 TAXI family TRAP transporter solute-binding subunit [Schinkia azotoformans]MEC1723650.1 TAXI family TRAP transporter solute-binding subunit [Schinkia azotoformans]MEC1743399.1 TAXI family TRAP transporter solute-binding subunit [Sc